MKKRYIQPSAEFEEIEGLADLLTEGSRWEPQGQGVNDDTNPEGMGGGINDVITDDPIGTVDDPNG